MADVSTWNPDNVNKLIADLMAELEVVKSERDTFRDAWRALTQELDRKGAASVQA
jgi:hypothetical protein